MFSILSEQRIRTRDSFAGKDAADIPSQIKQQRRLIARMKTELRQRELNNK